jgi:dTDP-4-amino-4,6-dideoxygalactose transaminase
VTLNEKTLCVIPTHLFGIPSDMNQIKSFCRKRDIFVVEDAAQAMGGKYNGKFLGTIGDVGFFSLGRGKNITCGSGGIIVTNSDIIASSIAKKVSCLKGHKLTETIKEFLEVMSLTIFIHPSLYWFPTGLSLLRLGETVFHKEFPIRRLSGMQAGFLRGWQKKLEESNRIRQENSEYFLNRLMLRSKIRPSNGASIPYLRLPILAKDRKGRDRLFLISSKKGLGLSLMYPTPVNEIEEIKDLFKGKTFPHAKEVSERLLTIPTHHLLSNEDKERISHHLSAINNS